MIPLRGGQKTLEFQDPTAPPATTDPRIAMPGLPSSFDPPATTDPGASLQGLPAPEAMAADVSDPNKATKPALNPDMTDLGIIDTPAPREFDIPSAPDAIPMTGEVPPLMGLADAPPAITDPAPPALPPLPSPTAPPATTDPIPSLPPLQAPTHDAAFDLSGDAGPVVPRQPDAAPDISGLLAMLAQQFGDTGGAAPAVGTIDPVNDLRSTVITGAPSDRTKTAQAATDAASKAMTTDATGLAAGQAKAAEGAFGVSPDAVSGANTAAQAALDKLTGTDRQQLVDQLIQQYMQQVGPDARLSKLQGQVDSAADNLAGVDRYKLALDKFNTFAEDSDPAFQKTLRDIMERETAAGGFTGRINTSFGDAGLTRERDLRSERSRLLQQALSDSVQDALSKEGALSGLEGQLFGQNLNRFNTAASVGTSNANADMGALESMAAAARGHAGDLTAAEQAAQSQGTTRAGQQLDAERSNVATKAALENQSSSQDQMDANALRGERDYEVGQESEGYQRALAQYREEQAAQEAAFEREMAILGAGMTGNPAGEIGSLATMVNPAVDMATLAQLAQGAGYASGYQPPQGQAPGGTDWGAILQSLMNGSAPVPPPTSTNQPPPPISG